MNENIQAQTKIPPREALAVIDQACASVNANRQTHAVIQQAVGAMHLLIAEVEALRNRVAELEKALDVKNGVDDVPVERKA